MPFGSRFRLTPLLAGGTLGVYLLILVGATAALADAAVACGGWPLCTGPVTPAVAVALGHRAGTAAVGALVLWTAITGWHRAAGRRIRLALLVAVTLYPVQVAVGALMALTGVAGALTAVHLLLAMAIFLALVLALAWQLEAETVGQDTTTPTGSPSTGSDPAHTGAPPRPAPDPASSRSISSGPSRRPGPLEIVRSYLALTKPRLMWLLSLVALAGMALAAGPSLSASTVAATLGGGVLAIGASGTFNHVLERDIDGRMARTSDRPVATDRVPVWHAAAFGVALATASIAVFLTVNPLVATLGLAAILFYSVIYTLVLKPHTVRNTVIGGAAGALPALIGWAAVTGTLGVPGLALAGLIFLWTPAHFYNLALAYREDYERADLPMLPVVRGPAVTRRHVLLYLGVTLLAAAILGVFTRLGWVYAATAAAVAAVFLWAVIRLHRERTDAAAMRAFHASNAYLGLLLVAVVVDAVAV